MPITPLAAEQHKCWLPFRDPSGNIVYFDVQSAKPGTFTIPGVIDLETYEPGSLAETSWIYFKGDPMAGPQPGHPFEMPFDNQNTNFTVDLVSADDTSTVVRHIMAPSNSTPFWDGGAPFGKRGRYSLTIPGLDRSCKYYNIASMIYLWTVPEDLDSNVDYRLKLTTDEPASTHLSGNLRISGEGAGEGAAPSSFMDLKQLGSSDLPQLGSLSNSNTATICAAGGLAALLFFVFLGVFKALRRSRRIALE